MSISVLEGVKLVNEFHKAFGVTGRDVELREKLFKEEMLEYYEAGDDLIEKADAIVDMMYIACGTVDLFEFDFSDYSPNVNLDEEFIKFYFNTIKAYKYMYKNIYCMVFDCIYSLAKVNGLLDLLPALFNEVHMSNMSKLGEDGKPILNGENGVFDERKPLGKVLKGSNYFEPNLRKIIYEG